MSPPESSVEEYEVLDLLTALVDKSLVAYDESTGRYRLLETVRQYGRDRMMESGAGERWRNRHLVHFLALAEEATPHLTGPGQIEWLAALNTEYENLRAALEWSLDLPDDGEMAVRMGAALWQYWNMQFRRSEGRPLLAAVLARPAASISSTASAAATFGAGVLAWYQGDLAEAQRMAEQSLAMCSELGDVPGVARALNSLGNLKSSAGDLAGALTCHEEALAIRRNLGDLLGVAMSLNNVGTLCFAQGDFIAARRCLDEGLAINKEHGSPWSVAIALVNLGEVECELGNFQASRTYFAECLEKTLELGWPGNPFLLEGLAVLAIAEKRYELASSLLGAAQRGREVAEVPLTPGEQSRVDARITSVRQALNDEALFDAAWAAGRAMTLEQAVEYAMREAGE